MSSMCPDGADCPLKDMGECFLTHPPATKPRQRSPSPEVLPVTASPPVEARLRAKAKAKKPKPGSPARNSQPAGRGKVAGRGKLASGGKLASRGKAQPTKKQPKASASQATPPGLSVHSAVWKLFCEQYPEEKANYEVTSDKKVENVTVVARNLELLTAFKNEAFVDSVNIQGPDVNAKLVLEKLEEARVKNGMPPEVAKRYPSQKTGQWSVIWAVARCHDPEEAKSAVKELKAELEGYCWCDERIPLKEEQVEVLKEIGLDQDSLLEYFGLSQVHQICTLRLRKTEDCLMIQSLFESKDKVQDFADIVNGKLGQVEVTEEVRVMKFHQIKWWSSQCGVSKMASLKTSSNLKKMGILPRDNKLSYRVVRLRGPSDSVALAVTRFQKFNGQLIYATDLSSTVAEAVKLTTIKEPWQPIFKERALPHDCVINLDKYHRVQVIGPKQRVPAAKAAIEMLNYDRETQTSTKKIMKTLTISGGAMCKQYEVEFAVQCIVLWEKNTITVCGTEENRKSFWAAVKAEGSKSKSFRVPALFDQLTKSDCHVGQKWLEDNFPEVSLRTTTKNNKRLYTLAGPSALLPQAVDQFKAYAEKSCERSAWRKLQLTPAQFKVVEQQMNTRVTKIANGTGTWVNLNKPYLTKFAKANPPPQRQPPPRNILPDLLFHQCDAATQFIHFEVLQGDITSACNTADALVCPSHKSLVFSAGAAGQINKKANLQKECEDWVAENGCLKIGEVYCGSGGDLSRQFKSIIHAPGPMWDRDDDVNESERLLRECVRGVMEQVDAQSAKVLVMPLLCGGNNCKQLDLLPEVYRTIMEAIMDYAAERPGVEAIRFVEYNPDRAQEFQKFITAFFQQAADALADDPDDLDVAGLSVADVADEENAVFICYADIGFAKPDVAEQLLVEYLEKSISAVNFTVEAVTKEEVEQVATDLGVFGTLAGKNVRLEGKPAMVTHAKNAILSKDKDKRTIKALTQDKNAGEQLLADAAVREAELVAKQKATAIVYPEHWDHSTAEHLIPLQRGCAEWQEVEKLFRETMPVEELLSVERVQAPILMKKYDQQRKLLQEKWGTPPVVKRLFHGTGTTTPETIYQNEMGFSRNFAGARSYWGLAAYFAVNASYSRGYGYKPAPGIRSFFLVDVLVGKTIELPKDNKIRTTPIVPGTKDQYDSIQGKTDGSTVYMTYADNRQNPVYLLTFRDKKSTFCL